MTFHPTRRHLITGAAALAAYSLLAPPLARRAWAQPRFGSDPFTLGIASGSPLPDSVVLWTRLAPQPLAAGGGMPAANVEVTWEIARDEAFRDIAGKGVATATPDFAHSVHVEANGLVPGRWYWYRFMTGDAVSAVGRTRTAPAPADASPRLRFAFASCQHYEQGYYAAYRHMREDDLDLVVFLGDYIYESSWGREHVRKHATPEPYTLDDYRIRYAQYKTDPDLQAMHRAAPWIVTWDDHEVDNDYANDRGEDLYPEFLARRAAAYRAYYEHMPLRAATLPSGPDMRLYTRYGWGTLAEFSVLDDRQYRDHQACPKPGRGGSNVVEECAERGDPARTLLGAAQERWLMDGLTASSARWNVIAQQTLMAQVDQKAGPGERFWTDGWDGYPAARRRLLDFLAARRPANPVVIGGDVHSNWVCDLKPDFNAARSPVVATEFCGTSISSQAWAQARDFRDLPENAHIRYVENSYRGYARVTVTPDRWAVDLRGLENEKRRDSAISTRAAFVVDNGKPGAHSA
jgi:alkaline phosphatase D